MSNVLQAKRGGHAIMYIYAVIIVAAALTAKALAITNTYYFMGIAVVAVIGGYFLTPMIFNKAAIEANDEGITTKKLHLVLWKDVNRIYVERVPKWLTQSLSKEDVYIVIETTDNRKDKFNVLFLAEGEPFSNKLIEFWKSKSNRA